MSDKNKLLVSNWQLYDVGTVVVSVIQDNMYIQEPYSMNEKTFRILSIDGGGIRGLYAATVLQKIEEHFPGKPITQHFDLICGTSTGGLIGLALSLGFNANTVSEFYTTHANTIFPKKIKLFKSIGKLMKNTYDSRRLRKALVQFFGEQRTLKECQSLLCIPSFNISTGLPIVFKQSCSINGYSRDKELNVIDVAMATASAPTYFRNHYIDHANLASTYCTDGGVWANNPSLCGLLEAWDMYVGDNKPFDSVALLSISTAPKPMGNHHKGGGLFQWKEDLMGTSLAGQSFFANIFLEKLANSSVADVSYRRIEPTNLSAQQQNLLEMDSSSKETLALLRRLGTQHGMDFIHQEREWIKPFFKTQKFYKL